MRSCPRATTVKDETARSKGTEKEKNILRVTVENERVCYTDSDTKKQLD